MTEGAFASWVRESIAPRSEKLSAERVQEIRDHYWRLMDSEEKQLGLELMNLIRDLKQQRDAVIAAVQPTKTPITRGYFERGDGTVRDGWRSEFGIACWPYLHSSGLITVLFFKNGSFVVLLGREKLSHITTIEQLEQFCRFFISPQEKRA